MTEQWKPIENCKGNYEVSNYGRVRNGKTGKILTPRAMRSGYLRVHVTLTGKKRDAYIHRLVAEAFCDHPNGYDVVNHIDNDMGNNRADNLEWTTQLGNVYHGMKQGRYKWKAAPVIAYKDGKQYKFDSINQAAKSLGCDTSCVTSCCKGKHKTHHGYEFRYAEVAV